MPFAAPVVGRLKGRLCSSVMAVAARVSGSSASARLIAASASADLFCGTSVRNAAAVARGFWQALQVAASAAFKVVQAKHVHHERC